MFENLVLMREDDIGKWNMWLYLKDRFSISNEAWYELSMNSEEPPCLHKRYIYM